MEHPYRAALGRASSVAARALVAETERAPGGVRVRAWSDGTTRLELRRPARLIPRLVFATPTLGALAAGAVAQPGDALRYCCVAALFAVLTLRTFRGERISVSPAAIARECVLARAEVRALADVTTVLVSGSGRRAFLDLLVGRERVPLAEGLGYDEATLRWIAQRLRRAIEAAR